ncbi:MAG TPA: hypothetical protein EYQ79_05000 [Flavobacteriaceae bacterium]|jgi:hypothetical protein|nr:hypothetical protein [Flavobacteriaceae bacterium]
MTNINKIIKIGDIDDTQDADATNGLPMNKVAIEKAKSFVQAGGKLEAIKKKYNVTPDIEKQLTTTL